MNETCAENSVSYWISNPDGSINYKTTNIDTEEIRKNILLNIYYSRMLGIRAKTMDVVNHVAMMINFQCWTKEKFYNRDRIVIPYFEAFRILAQMYEAGYVKTVEIEKEAFCELDSKGKDRCKEMLMIN